MSAAELARQIEVPVNRIAQIINGQRPIAALRLGHRSNTGPEIWLNLQQFCELRRAQAEIGAAVARLPRRNERRPTTQPGSDREVHPSLR